MAVVENRFVCDLSKPVQAQALKGNVFSLDNLGSRISVLIYENGQPATISGSVTANCILPDGSTVNVNGSMATENGGSKAYVDVPQSCLLIPGILKIAIKCTSSSVITTLAAIVANVYITKTDNVITPSAQIINDWNAEISSQLASAVKFSSQSLTDAQKLQARSNIGAASTADVTAEATARENADTTLQGNIDAEAATRAAADADLKSALSEETRNLWKWGDQTVTGQEYVFNLTDSIPAGTYTLSAEIERASSANCRMLFYKNSISAANTLANPYIASGSRNSATFTLAEAANIVVVWSGAGSASTVQAIWRNIQLETGSTATDYIPPITATDFTAREQNAQINREIEDVDDKVDDIFDQIVQSLGTHDEYDPITIPAGTGYGNGKYWNCDETTATLATSTNYYAYAQFSVSEGEKYRISVYEGGSDHQKAVLLVDDNYLIKRTFGNSSAGLKTYDITVQSGETLMLITSLKANITENVFKKAFPHINVVSESIAGKYDFKGKKIAIIGDSISTNGAWSVSNPNGNVPEIIIQDEDVNVSLSAYVTYNDIGTELYGTVTIDGETTAGHTIVSGDVGKEITIVPADEDIGTQIGKPANKNSSSIVTWWEIVAEKYGGTFIPVCWSGSSITGHEGNNPNATNYNQYKASYAWHPATIRKCGVRIPGVANGSIAANRTPPDMVIIYRGTNDMTHNPYTRLTDYLDTYPVNIPETDAYEDDGTKYDYVRGLLLTIAKVHEAYPYAKIVLCTLNYFHRLSTSYPGYPSRNGINTIYDYNNAIRAVANYTGCDLIEFDKDGITYANASRTYYTDDTDTDFVHPSTAGHAIMGNRALCDLYKINKDFGD